MGRNPLLKIQGDLISQIVMTTKIEAMEQKNMATGVVQTIH